MCSLSNSKNKNKNTRRQTRMSVSGLVLVCIGVAAVAAAFILFLYAGAAAGNSREKSRQVLETLREVIPGGEEQTGPDGEHFSVLEAGGFSCIGYVEVPESKLAWPVEDAKGSGGVIPFLADDTDGKLLIRGPRALFESLSDVKVGSRVILTDVYGVSRSYEVISSGLVDDADKIERTDLILCTKDSFSGLYVVSCRAEQ